MGFNAPPPGEKEEEDMCWMNEGDVWPPFLSEASGLEKLIKLSGGAELSNGIFWGVDGPDSHIL